MSASITAPAEATTIQENAQREAARLKALNNIFGDRFVKSFASPVLFMENQELKSPVSIRFFKKDFEYLSKQLYLEYQYRSWKGFNQDILARYTELTTKKLEAIKTLMGNTVNRLQKLLDQQGYKLDGSLWPTSLKLPQMPVIAAHARSYFDVLCMLDRVYLLAGTANLFGVIDSAQRAEAEFICKKAVRAFRSVLQSEVVRLYREADRLLQEQNSAGHADPQMVALVQQQGQEIKDFAAAADEEAHTDNGMDLGGQDAAQMIEEAAAASPAAAAAGGAKRRTSRKTADADGAGAPAAAAPAVAAGAAAAS
jgi:hypothetical protein